MSNFLAMSDEDFLNNVVPPESESVPQEIEEFEDSDDTEEYQEETSESKPVEEEGDYKFTPTEEGEDVYESDLNYLVQPLSINGNTLQVRNREEARRLMEMGAQLQQQASGMDSSLKTLKTLELNGIEGKDLNFLIDLKKNNPKAIAKLLKDSNYESSYDEEDESDYVPTDYTVPDNVLQLDKTITSIKSTPTYTRTMDTVNQWDIKSRNALTDNPQLLGDLNQQIATGVYDKIMNEVTHIKQFGGLTGMGDFEAYRTVGAQLYQQGKLQEHVSKPIQLKKVVPKRDTALVSKRKAASAPSGSSKTTTQKETKTGHFLSMSDEEFTKKYGSAFN